MIDGLCDQKEHQATAVHNRATVAQGTTRLYGLKIAAVSHVQHYRATMQTKGLDWNSLLRQQPHPSSVVKQNRPKAAEHTPGTPKASTSTPSFTHSEDSAIPVLFMKHVMPEGVQEERVSTEVPAAELLTKLAEARMKAAELIREGMSSKQPGAVKQQLSESRLLRNPLPAPQHVQQDSCLWFDQEQQVNSGDHQFSAPGTSQYDADTCSTSTAGCGGSRGIRSTLPQPSVMQQPSAGDLTSMRTSATGQSADSSLLTTAHSPSMQWQSALSRLRQLQQQTEEALLQGVQVGT